MTKFTLVWIMLMSGVVAAYAQEGYWRNDQALGANWTRWKDQVYFVHISKQWKELFEGQIDKKSGLIEGRMVSIKIGTWERFEQRVTLKRKSQDEILVLQPSGHKSSYLHSKYLHFEGLFSFYENIDAPIFDKKHQKWEIKSVFQDGDTLATVFYDGNSIFDKGVFINRDSIVFMRYVNFRNNGCASKEILCYKMLRDGYIYTKARDAAGTCIMHPTTYAWSGTIRERYIPNGNIPIGISSLDPNEVPLPDDLVQLRVTGVFLNDKKIDPDAPLLLEKPYQLKTNQKISFQFSSLLGLNLHYKLEGLEEKWKRMRAGDRVSYNHLPPGNYLFKVCCNLKYPEFPGATATFALRVIRPLHQQWWFYTLVVVGVLGVTAGLFWQRERRRRKNESLRLHIARELHDDIGSILSSISVLSEAAKQQILGEAVNLETIGGRAREAIDRIGDIVWSMNPKPIDIPELILQMRSYATELLEAKNIHLHFDQNELLQHLRIKPTRRKDFYLFFKETINNTAKYAQAKNVWVELTQKENKLSLTITDDGIGFDPLQVKKGNGLKNMQVRAQHLGGQCFVRSGVGEGTTVLLTFPIT